MNDELLGQRLGRYEIQQEVGQGGMARVYRALDTQLERTVALKVMAAHLNADSEFARRFQREAILAANLRHPAIVTIYDVGEADGWRYIAMEFVLGRSVHAILRERQALGLAYALGMLQPVSAALDYAHSQQAVHRDVKPHNILIDRTGRVLLADFGIAQPADADAEGLTRTGIFMGTPEYISPEQAEGKRVDGRSDLYSLAIVAYEIITGRVPFMGSTPQLLLAHAQTPPPAINDIVPDLPGELNLVFTRALAKRPEERFQSGAALVEALTIIARRHQITPARKAEIATLATSQQSSAGRPTIAVDLSGTPIGTHPPTLAQPRSEAPAPMLPDVDDTSQDLPRPPRQSALTPEDMAALGLGTQPSAPVPSAERPMASAERPAERPMPSAGRAPIGRPVRERPATPPPPPTPPRSRVMQQPAGDRERPRSRGSQMSIPLVILFFVVAVALLAFIFNSISGSTDDRVIPLPAPATQVPIITPEQPTSPPPPTNTQPVIVPPIEQPTEAPPVQTPPPPPTLEIPTATPLPPPPTATPPPPPTATPPPPTATPPPPTATPPPTPTEVAYPVPLLPGSSVSPTAESTMAVSAVAPALPGVFL